MTRTWLALALVACASPPPPAPKAAARPLPVVVERSDAGRCEASRGDDVLADPAVVGTYPKRIARLDQAALAARRKELGDRNPGVDFRVDVFGYVIAFGVPAPRGPLTTPAEIAQLEEDAKCAHADLRGFVSKETAVGKIAGAPAVYFMRAPTLERVAPLIVLPAPMDSALLAPKWKLTVEYARERVTIAPCEVAPLGATGTRAIRFRRASSRSRHARCSEKWTCQRNI
ncbi:MAG TPA: hypothetical protein VGH28_04820 [Polyangiaceae bacterium]|jgi:hypothetical protein